MSEFEDIREILKTIALNQNLFQIETDRRFKETAERFKETGKQFKEIAERFRETDKQIKTLVKRIDANNSELKGLTQNQGQLLEKIFHYSVYRRKDGKFLFDGISYDFAFINKIISGAGIYAEIDIILENGDYVAILEVKSRAKYPVINQLKKSIEVYKKSHPSNKHKIIKGYICSFQFTKGLVQSIQENGFKAFTLKGDFVELEGG